MNGTRGVVLWDTVALASRSNKGIVVHSEKPGMVPANELSETAHTTSCNLNTTKSALVWRVLIKILRVFIDQAPTMC